jgi:ubiquinone/menaquinone biosynthesis C-methylase UbiE
MSIDNLTDAGLDWFATPIGIYLQGKEQVLFDDAVSNIFGFNALQIGLLEIDLLRNSRIPYIFHVDVNAGQLLCDSAQLPFLSNSIDLLVMPHGLDFSRYPHETLREAERVLLPEGYVIMTGFNPFSFWGLTRFLRKRKEYPWQANFLTLLRVKDWLALLGLEIVSTQMTCYSPPLSSPKWLRRFEFMDKIADKWWPMMGGVYFIVAQKRVVNMRLIKPKWKKTKLKGQLASAPTQTNTNKSKSNIHFDEILKNDGE